MAQWLSTVRAIRPRAVQVYTLEHNPAWPNLVAVPLARLREIAEAVGAAGIPASAYGAAES